MSDLYDRIAAYFAGRFELVDTPGYGKFRPAVNAAIQCLDQQRFDRDLDQIKVWQLTTENMIGYLEDRVEAIEQATEAAKETVANMFEIVGDIDITDLSVMVNGSNRPIRIQFQLPDVDIERAVYVKPFEEGKRLLGLELYRLIGDLDEEYEFVFNKGVVVEQEVEGKHEFDLPLGITNKARYAIEFIKADLFSFTTGLDDVFSKQDNYLITPSGRIALIDFDVMNRIYTPEDIEFIKGTAMQQLGLTREEYSAIYTAQEELLGDRIAQRREQVDQIITIMESDEELRESGEYIRRNIEALTSNLNS